VEAGRQWIRPGASSASEGRTLRTIRGDEDDLRAMKRALANAPLGPKATLALTSAIIALEDDDRVFDDLERRSSSARHDACGAAPSS
jgi:hypothetical protein